MKKVIITIISLLLVSNLFSQVLDSIKMLDINQEIKEDLFHFRTNKGDILSINITPEFKNEKKGTRYDLKTVRFFRQFSNQEFQYIAEKKDAEQYSIQIMVPSDGIYSLYIDRGGSKKFNTAVTVYRTPKDEASKEVKRNAVMVSIPDTLHIYTKDSLMNDYIRVSTPFVKKDTIPKYKEDQIFLDVAYALRIGNDYAIPIHIPYELYTLSKRATSVKWGFILTVGNEVYEGLKNKMAQVATAAIDMGVGKAMSGGKKVDGAIDVATNTSKIKKGYDVFDKAATANAVAGISGDVAEASNIKAVTNESKGASAVTAFTGLSESAGNALAQFAPRIEDKVHWKLMSHEEYKKYLSNQPYNCKKGTDGYVRDSVIIKDPNELYYLVIENERDIKGKSFVKDLESIGKTILSQYVYVTLKVWVQREVLEIRDLGYYENTLYPVYKTKWNYKQTYSRGINVVFEDEVLPYYTVLNNKNIY